MGDSHFVIQGICSGHAYIEDLGDHKPQAKTVNSGHAKHAGSILGTRDVLDEDLDQDGLRSSVKCVRGLWCRAESWPVYGRQSSCTQLHLGGHLAANELYVPEQINHTPFSEEGSSPEFSILGRIPPGTEGLDFTENIPGDPNYDWDVLSLTHLAAKDKKTPKLLVLPHTHFGDYQGYSC